MRDRLRRWVVSGRPSALAQVGLALLALAIATAARLGMMRLAGGSVPFLTFFPAILIVTVFTGRVGAIVALTGGVLLSALFAPPIGQLSPQQSQVAAGLLMAAFGGFISYVALMLREALQEAHERREQEHLLLLEIQHRVKNSLAVVQSIAAQTLGQERTVNAEKFMERLFAFGEVQNMLSSSGWRPIAVRALAERALQPFQPGAAERIRLDGEDLELPPDLAINLGLALHELGTNALKHGALSNDQGRVRLSWQQAGAGSGVLYVLWTERGGPTVQAPTASGFGSRLLQRNFGGAARARPKLEFRPDGVSWSVELPLKVRPELAALPGRVA